MKETESEDPRLSQLTRICLELPEGTRETHGQHAMFRVRKKTFAYFLSNHHGDGIVSVCCKVGDRQLLPGGAEDAGAAGGRGSLDAASRELSLRMSSNPLSTDFKDPEAVPYFL